ncbi:MAG: 3-hydroxyacyl-CoA dehydrogenase family protein [Desulfomonilaceae bacterium]
MYTFEVPYDKSDDLRCPKYRPPGFLKKMGRTGRLGRKSGKGIYDYS